MSSPPSETGVDEPMFVCGAIAAMSADIAITAPAESALEPGGETYTITGTSAARKRLTIPRIDDASPPGVSRTRTTAANPSSSARSTAFSTYSCVTGLMSLSR